MSQASSNFDRAASGIARAPAPPSTTEYPIDAIDLSQEVVTLLQARNDFAANSKTARVADGMNRSVLDMIG